MLVITIFFDEYIDVYAAGFSFGITLSTQCMLGVVFLSKVIEYMQCTQAHTLVMTLIVELPVCSFIAFVN